MNVMMLLEMATDGFGDRVAIQNGGDRLTYAELFAASGAAARTVGASGAGRLAVLDVNSLAVPVGLFAAAWAGIPFVPLNYRLTGGELDALLASIAPAYLVTDGERAPQLGGAGTVVARERFLAEARARGERAGEWGMDPDAIAILLFTSGTTGAPKAAVLRQKHLVSYIFGSVEFGGADERDAALVSVPPYHIAGMAAILSSVYSGRRVVQLTSFDAETWVATARAEQVTHAFVVPTMLTRIVDVLARTGTALPQLRAVSYGGGKMPQPVIERAMDLLPDTAFTNAYGLTETSSTITVLGPEDHRAAAASDDPVIRRRLVSVGRALPSVELEVRDDEGRPAAAGCSGEIHVRGEQVSGEYLGLASRMTSDGWFPTRDAGALDADGYLFLEGRIDDVIVRGGENLSPGEIEEVLLAHPAIADCAVVGIADVQWGETVAAVVVVHPGRTVGADEVRDWVKARLRSSRAPARVEFRNELPYSETGKLLRRKIREELAREAS